MYIILVSLLCGCLGTIVYLIYKSSSLLIMYRFNNLVKKISKDNNVDIMILVDDDQELHSKYIFSINDSQKFVNALRDNSKENKTIYLIIHCNGGHVSSSDVIINAMLRHNNQIYVFIPNYAASAATLVAFSSTKIFIDTYAYVTPTDPQITLDDGSTYSSNVLGKFLKLKDEKNYDIILTALDAKIFHNDNIETVKKIIKNKKNGKMPKKKLKKFIDTFCQGNLPHHYPIYGEQLKKYGLDVELNIPDEIMKIFENFISL